MAQPPAHDPAPLVQPRPVQHRADSACAVQHRADSAHAMQHRADSAYAVQQRADSAVQSRAQGVGQLRRIDWSTAPSVITAPPATITTVMLVG